jgi:hypothetical protein
MAHLLTDSAPLLPVANNVPASKKPSENAPFGACERQRWLAWAYLRLVFAIFVNGCFAVTLTCAPTASKRGISMADVQDEIELLQVEIEKANAAIAKALRERRAINKDSPLVADFNATVAAARQALLDVEVKLRKLYESKGD